MVGNLKVNSVSVIFLPILTRGPWALMRSHESHTCIPVNIQQWQSGRSPHLQLVLVGDFARQPFGNGRLF